MMKECWEALPENRPSFKQLYIIISKFIERIAGYLEIGFNPFTGDEGNSPEEDEADEEGAESEPESDVAVEMFTN